MNLRTFLFSIAIWYFYQIGWSQNSQLQSFTIEDGLPQSQVYALIQDEIGYLWLGTQGGGIARFNGEEFKTWNVKDGLQSNYIHSIAAINDSLFIGTKGGLSIKTKNSFVNFEGPTVNKIYNFNNQIYLATNIGVYTYSKKEGFTKLKLKPKINTSIIYDIVYDGKLFWIASNTGLWKLNKIKPKAKIMQRHSAFNFTTAVFYNNKVYAAAQDKGILVINTNAKSYGNIWISAIQKANHLAVFNRTELWVSTSNEGIKIINLSTGEKQKELRKKNGLTVSNIKSCLLDKQSNIWIATSGGGLYKYFENNFTHYSQKNGLKGDRVYAVHKSKDGIWASNSEAGMVRIDSIGIQHIPQDDRISEVKIKTITSDTLGNIWAGTEGKGILFKERFEKDSIVYDTLRIQNAKKDSLFIKIDTISKVSFTNHVIDKDKGLIDDWVSTIVLHEGMVWAATYSNGIMRFSYDPKKQKLSKIKKFTAKNGIKDLQISNIKADPTGKIWYSTQNGHLGYIWNNRVKHLGAVINQKSTISNLVFYKNNLYLGTSGKGIWWSDLLQDKIKFKKLRGKKKLYSDNIYQLIFDDRDNLWAGTERGVDKIVLNQTNEIVDVFHFGRNDGFLGMETCKNAVTKDDLGNLWFGAIYGLTKYQPTTGGAKTSTIKPKLFFEDVEVAYQSIDSIHLGNWISNGKSLTLTPEQTELSFTFKTVDLDHPNDVTYRWKLNTSEWSPWSSDFKQNLAGLAYGKHSFTAQSRDYRWQESDPVTFNFFIDSPIYEKTWFQWTVLLISILLIAAYGWSYVQKVKIKNAKEQERLQMQNHLLSLEQKALRLQMNPHFIFNALNGIKAMSTNDPQRMHTTINTFATLLRETLYNSRKDQITLDQEIKTLKHYIEIEKLMARKAFTYDISVNSDLDPEEVLIPPMLIQPFVENAVRHGILKGERFGELKIKFHTTEDFLYCSVLDNGMGIFQSQKGKAKTDHQSMALTVTRERLASISGENALQIKEIVEEDQTIAGTQIEFKIPLLTDY